jgi:hypothetical protein
MLYDIGARGGSEGLSGWRIESMKTLSGDVLQMLSKPQLLDTYLALHGYDSEMGEYWQTPNGTFQFHIKNTLSLRFHGHISDIAPAPSNSFSGTKDEGAVPWLYIIPMSDSAPEPGSAISAVYRYHTAGGKPPRRCVSVGQVLQIPYAALYWMYETPKRRKSLAIEDAQLPVSR